MLTLWWPSALLLLLRSLQEQLADLYQGIHSSANTTLLQQYEEVIHSLVSQTLDNRLECDQLETSIKRWGEISVFSSASGQIQEFTDLKEADFDIETD